jgi:hypothetical protein
VQGVGFGEPVPSFAAISKHNRAFRIAVKQDFIFHLLRFYKATALLFEHPFVAISHKQKLSQNVANEGSLFTTRSTGPDDTTATGSCTRTFAKILDLV